ncbi:MAG: hypothetical protein BWY15_02434 [Firmicutes bacterium ADurb.Bin193]|nr:MAG: hypothetical protein BWY15_02434 [Firmicutes bacterium ADurb.Bin193]
MARPKKLSTDQMINIVDSFFESNGDPSRLKCSFLEEYAVSLGIAVKAYDFRRDEDVRRRMEELRNSVKIDEVGVVAYKSMDADAFLNRNHTREMMRNSLLELDETWRRVYEKAADLSKKNRGFLADIFSKNQTIEALSSDKAALVAKLKVVKTASDALLLENRYLKKALKQYLYPAVANEILKNENVLEQGDTEVAPEAMSNLTDPAVPATFSNSIAADREMLSREEALLNRMQNQIFGGDNNA